MRRFKAENFLTMKEDKEGAFILYVDAVDALNIGLKFALDHADDIENKVNDFAKLKPLLEIVRGVGSS